MRKRKLGKQMQSKDVKSPFSAREEETGAGKGMPCACGFQAQGVSFDPVARAGHATRRYPRGAIARANSVPVAKRMLLFDDCRMPELVAPILL